MPRRSRCMGHSRCRAGWTSSHWNSASSTEARVRSICRPCPSRRKSQKRRCRKRAWLCTPPRHGPMPAAAPLPQHQGQAAFLRSPIALGLPGCACAAEGCRSGRGKRAGTWRALASCLPDHLARRPRCGRSVQPDAFNQRHNLLLAVFARLANKSSQHIYKDIDACRFRVGPQSTDSVEKSVLTNGRPNLRSRRP